jgi:hypothetical protein
MVFENVFFVMSRWCTLLPGPQIVGRLLGRLTLMYVGTIA